MKLKSNIISLGLGCYCDFIFYSSLIFVCHLIAIFINMSNVAMVAVHKVR
jgi:hypothetical protein